MIMEFIQYKFTIKQILTQKQTSVIKFTFYKKVWIG